MAKERKVKKDEMVTIYGTGESFMKANIPYKVHAVAAEKLVKKGAATEQKPTEGKTKYADGYAKKGTGIAGQRIRESEHTNPPKGSDAKDSKK